AAREVTARLREAGRRGRSLRRWMVGLAAAAAVVLYAAVRPDPGPAVTGAPVAEARFFPELDSLSTEELAVVAEEVDRPASELDPVAGQHLFDLDTTQLERVLRSLEG
ncbi:MAG TPA: hypothetical protein VFI13_05640, partial [Gemmatimonadales bacterium]|nr:hypothetical protein [Gemmatimonadales bacterium]